MLTRFIAANRRACRAIEAWLPGEFRRHLHTLYKYEVADLLNRGPGRVVLDVGSGKECPFLPFIDERRGHFIIGIDASEHELRLNPDPDAKIVGDAAGRRLPFRDGSLDLVVSRSVVEHLHDNGAFFTNCARVLRPGGMLVHTFPCRFAPFSVINQLVPNVFARWLITHLHPYWEGDCGFVAFYDNCYFSAVRRLLKSNAFQNPRFVFRYYQSIYFNFFLPLYMVMLLYDLVIWVFGLRNLACAMLVTAERSGAGDVADPGAFDRADVVLQEPAVPLQPKAQCISGG